MLTPSNAVLVIRLCGDEELGGGSGDGEILIQRRGRCRILDCCPGFTWAENSEQPKIDNYGYRVCMSSAFIV